ncbi:MAG: 50S ribosomal protein L9 [Verrucomicrobiales bacterium]
MPTVEVILKEQIKGLGAEADIVKVRAGYARNFLVPQGVALEATRTNKTRLKALQARRSEREAKELTDAESVAAKLKKVTLRLTLKTGADGKAFGSVTAHDVAAALAEQGPKGLVLDRHAVQLDKGIKQTGKFDIPVRLHPQVTANVRLVVSPESGAEEAPTEESEAS